MKKMPSAQGKLLEVDGLFAEADPIARKIAILRSNAMAHRSANLNYNDAFKKAKIAADDMMRLTDITLGIINAMQTIIGVPISEFDANAIYELRALAARPLE